MRPIMGWQAGYYYGMYRDEGSPYEAYERLWGSRCAAMGGIMGWQGAVRAVGCR